MTRLVLRWSAFNAPYPWFQFANKFAVSSVAGDDLGKAFFEKFAERVKATFVPHAEIGLMDSIESLQSEDFDSDKIHPLIREFYEKTSRFDMKISIWWNPIVKPLGALYLRLIARRTENLQVPLSSEGFTGLDNWLDVVDIDPTDQKIDYRCWVRVLKDSESTVYVGAYKTYRSEIDSRTLTYVSVSFPLPGCNITTVLSPSNFSGNGLMLATRNKWSTESGVYLVVPRDRPFFLLPAFGLSERFLLTPSEDGNQVNVSHTCFWVGIRAFEMKYEIYRMKTRERERVGVVFGRAKIDAPTSKFSVDYNI